MKKLYTLILLSIAIIGFAQPPAGYYNSATGTGYTLKTQLYNIIKNHDDKGYAGLYTTYLTSDKDFFYENNGTVLDMYTEKPTGTECEYTYGVNQDDGSGGTAECQKYNREHLIPQSVFSSATPMYSDAHFVVPSDKYVNGQRGNFPFGRVGTPNYTSSNGSKRGNNLNSGYSAGYTGVVFEPIDEFKGDIARMILYFATRYQNQVSGWSYDMFNGSSDQVFTVNAINVLLTWHLADPVSAREIARNNAVYIRQDNRNPFIDNPQYALDIWGPLLDVNSVAMQNTAIFPNPSNDGTIYIQTELPLEDISILNINGQLIRQIKNPAPQNNSYVIGDLPQGFYFLKMTGNHQSATRKIVIN